MCIGVLSLSPKEGQKTNTLSLHAHKLSHMYTLCRNFTLNKINFTEKIPSNTFLAFIIIIILCFQLTHLPLVQVSFWMRFLTTV